MILSRFLLFFVMIHDVKERPQDESHPPQPRQLIAPSIRNYLPLRSPLSGGEGSLWLHLYGKLCKTDAHIKPSPLERGDRSGASLGEARVQTREAIVVDEIHPTDALSRLMNSEKAEAYQDFCFCFVSPLFTQPHQPAFLYFIMQYRAMRMRTAFSHARAFVIARGE